MVKSKSFSSARSTAKPEAVNFELNGQTFNCLPRRSGATVLEAISRLTGDGSGLSQAASIVPFLTSSVVEADRDAFTALITDDEDPIDFDVLIEIMSYLLETYTARPTKE